MEAFERPPQRLYALSRRFIKTTLQRLRLLGTVRSIRSGLSNAGALYSRARSDRALIPPIQLIRSNSGMSSVTEYIAIGNGSLQSYLIDLGGLQPDDKLLDVGCGVGLMARPLTTYLGAAGSYDGFDVAQPAISWCKRVYRRYPRFRFLHANVYNKYYNRTGRYPASEYIFPYEDESFDVVFLYSVFTHMLPDDVRHYVTEISRVLKTGGRCVITYFLLNSESRDRIGTWLRSHPIDLGRGVAGSPDFPFEHGSDGCLIYDEDVPEIAIAYDEKFLRTTYAKHRLSISSILYGEWCRGQYVPGWQDAVAAVKR